MPHLLVIEVEFVFSAAEEAVPGARLLFLILALSLHLRHIDGRQSGLALGAEDRIACGAVPLAVRSVTLPRFRCGLRSSVVPVATGTSWVRVPSWTEITLVLALRTFLFLLCRPKSSVFLLPRTHKADEEPFDLPSG